MSWRLMHVGIAVRSVEKSSRLFSKLLGIPAGHMESVADQGVKTVFFPAGQPSLELLEATGEDSAIAAFLQKRGEGIHHLSFEVDNIEEEILRLKIEGFTMVDEEPRPGAGRTRVAFIHPKSTNGVLVELCQKKRT